MRVSAMLDCDQRIGPSGPDRLGAWGFWSGLLGE